MEHRQTIVEHFRESLAAFSSSADSMRQAGIHPALISKQESSLKWGLEMLETRRDLGKGGGRVRIVLGI